MKFMLEN